MNIQYAIEQLDKNAERVRALVEGVEESQARWKPDEASWSILETVTHLYDEEREDFRVRFDLLLHRPEADWPPIDPQGWVVSRRYNERSLGASLEGYLTERDASLVWLRSLDAPDLERAKQAPWGIMTAGDMLAAWVAHDVLHLRQLVELLYAYQSEGVRPYSNRYAGDW